MYIYYILPPLQFLHLHLRRQITKQKKKITLSCQKYLCENNSREREVGGGSVILTHLSVSSILMVTADILLIMPPKRLSLFPLNTTRMDKRKRNRTQDAHQLIHKRVEREGKRGVPCLGFNKWYPCSISVTQAYWSEKKNRSNS